MHTPSSYMYADLRSFGGISNKAAASDLLTEHTLYGNAVLRDRINERTFLSRQIVHATPDRAHPEFFADFHKSAQTITSKIVSNLGRPTAYDEVIHHYGEVASRGMAALLDKYSLDGNLYANGVHRINVSPMTKTHDKAVLLVMMFVVAGCLANPELAIEITRSFMKKAMPFTFSTLQPTTMEPSTLLQQPDKQTKLGVSGNLKVRDSGQQMSVALATNVRVSRCQTMIACTMRLPMSASSLKGGKGEGAQRVRGHTEIEEAWVQEAAGG